MGEEARLLAERVAAGLRAKGLWAETDVMGRGLKPQMKYANKTGARYTVVLGEDEVATGKAGSSGWATAPEAETTSGAVGAERPRRVGTAVLTRAGAARLFASPGRRAAARPQD